MMFKFYLVSIVMWWVIILVTISITAEQVNQNGWLELSNAEINAPNRFSALIMFGCMTFALAAIPVLRIIFEASAIMMSSMTPEEAMEWFNRR